MAKKLFKKFFRIAEFILGFIAILSLILLIRLSQGPIEIKNLTPVILDGLTEDRDDVQVDVKNAYIELAISRGRLMDVRLDELNISDAEGFVLMVQKANVSFNPFWLLVGKLAVRDVELEQPYLQMDFSKKKTVFKTEKKRPVGRSLNRLRRYLERLDSIKTQDAQMVFKLDEKASISLPNLKLNMTKNASDQMNLSVESDLYFDGAFSKINLNANYDLNSKKLLFKTHLNNIDLPKMQELSAYLKNVNLTLDIFLDGTLDLGVLKTGWQNAIEKISFELTSQKSGTVDLPAPLSTSYLLNKALIKGSVLSGLKGLEVKNSVLEIKNINKPIEINASLTGLYEFFQTKNISNLLIHLNASTSDIKMIDVPKLWPKYTEPDVHQWIEESVSDGDIKTATLDMDMKGTEVTDLVSVVLVENAVVDYLDEMEPAKKVKTKVTLGLKEITMEILSGSVGNINLVGGSVDFLELDNEEVSYFDMDVQFEGKIKDGLDVVSAQPLDVCSAMPISCKSVFGKAKGNVKLSFPFFADKDVEDYIEEYIKFSVNSKLDDASFPVPDTNWKIGQGNFDLFVDNNGMTLSGKALLEDNLVTISVVENFEENSYEKSKYQVQVPLTVSMITPYFSYIDDFFKGSLLADITLYPKSKKDSVLDIKLDLKDAEISLPIGYEKELKQDGTLTATALIENSQLVSIPSISLIIPEEQIVLKGKVNFPKNTVFELDLSEIKAPKTDAQMVLRWMQDNSFDLSVFGKSLNVSNLIHGSFFSQNENDNVETVQDFNISAKLDKVYFSEVEPFEKVNILLRKKDGHWEDMNGSLTGNVPFVFSLDEDKEALNIKTEDVGDFLYRTGFSDRIQGGILNTTVKQDSLGNLSGELFIENYKLKNISFFMQAATLLGIVDALQGDSISFDKAIIPFVLSDKNDLQIQDAVASGTALGFTMRGAVENGKIDMSGSVVPAYALNSLPGKIPLLGTVFSGENGGGLFGVSYSIQGNINEPEISFNPASLLAPGIFRRLFDAF